MTEYEWISIGTKIKNPIEELAKKLNYLNIEFLGISVYGKAGFATAVFRESEKEFSVTVDKNGKMELKNNEGRSYYSSI